MRELRLPPPLLVSPLNIHGLVLFKRKLGNQLQHPRVKCILRLVGQGACLADLLEHLGLQLLELGVHRLLPGERLAPQLQHVAELSSLEPPADDLLCQLLLCISHPQFALVTLSCRSESSNKSL